MNDPASFPTDPSDFEQHLRSLQPRPAATDEGQLMYACGFAAGRASHGSATTGDRHSAPRLRFLLAMAAALLLTATLSAGGGYGVAMRNAGDAGQERVLVEDRDAAELPQGVPSGAGDAPSGSSERTEVEVAVVDGSIVDGAVGDAPPADEPARRLATSEGPWSLLMRVWLGDPVAGLPATWRDADNSGEATVLTARSDPRALAGWMASHRNPKTFPTPAVDAGLTGGDAVPPRMLTPRSPFSTAAPLEWIQ